ncbi:peptidase [Spongiactinospora rosea]|uniref:alpha-amylase n=1 Tax=Spongiactinospora rosea TaxID=2248750 RepID=A0A366LWH2_9ACTN|nr:peptidase [Spongiactinospora rosea]
MTRITAVFCLLLTSGLLSPSTAQAAAPDPVKIHKTVQTQLDTTGKSTYWVRLKGDADLGAARRAKAKDDKAAQVYRAKTEWAASSQAKLRELLKSRHADFSAYWIVNEVRVTADSELTAEIAKLPEVASITPVTSVTLPQPAPGRAAAKVDAVEWNVDRINAPRVWSERDDRGEGIVVATIDTGAQFDHPDLAASYRGRNADGTVDHAYNWYDASGTCPSAAPCDEYGHGTHVTGTIAGANGIGVAPGARWIAVKGCVNGRCSDEMLLAAAQWVLAPTDLNGRNPRTDLAPDIVNNSWGGRGLDEWYKESVDAWIAAGIFPVFANGNSGPACRTSDSPAQYVQSYSVGGFDVNNALYNRSSKGEGENGEIKPNIAAPAVDVRSSVPGGGYEIHSGTSMATPHVAATVALIWSAAPSLQGKIAATRQVLDGTAIDVNDTSCGGTATDNNVWGEGRLDAYAAVQAAPRDPLGDLRGTATSDGTPLSGAKVTVRGPVERELTTGADGTFAVPRLLAGDYKVTVAKFGYDTTTANVTIVAGQSADPGIVLPRTPTAVVSGTVTTIGTIEPGATVEAVDTPVRAVTDASGRYRMTLPHGDHTLRVVPASRCSAGASAPVTVAGETARDFDLPLRSDAFGYTCSAGPREFVAGTHKLDLRGDDDARYVALPFTVPYYGKGTSVAWVNTNGYIGLDTSYEINSGNTSLPSRFIPDSTVYPFWDDIVVDDAGAIYTGVIGVAPHRRYVVEWRNVTLQGRSDQRVTFSALLGEDGSIGFRYKDIDSADERGASATIGIENATSTDALMYSFDEPAVAGGQGIEITPSGHGLVGGVVTDANDGRPLAGATVAIGDVATLTTGADGRFFGQVLSGDHQVKVSMEHYGTVEKPITIIPGEPAKLDAALITGAVSASTTELTAVMHTDSTRSRKLRLTNLGARVAYTATGDRSWFDVSSEAGELAAGQAVDVDVTFDSTGKEPGTYWLGTLVVESASGRQPVIEVKVTLVVTKLQIAVDAGGSGPVTDAGGDAWTPDRRYTEGSYGYITTRNRTESTSRTIKGTDDQALYRTARESMLEYRFDKIPDGVYTVELDFADLRSTRPGARVFDVLVEGAFAIPALDLALESGTYTAVPRQYTVRVSDGQLNVRFATRQGATIVNAIRVSERSDRADG